MANRNEVEELLAALKEPLSRDRGFFIIPRPANNSTMRYLGLTAKNCRDLIGQLVVENYSSGPEADTTRPDLSGEVWIFGQRIKGTELYIKLKVFEVRGATLVKCLSFHEAQYPMRYPFAGRR